MSIPFRFPWLSLVLLAAVFRLNVSAALTVNTPQTITHKVVVQPILVRKTSGAIVPGMGNLTSEAYIKEQINRVWAQVGVRIDWLPAVTYTNNFAYDGTPGIYETTPRPTTHLDGIVDAAPSPPKSADPRVINMFFVEICPAFEHLDDDYANGLAFLDGNGVAVHVGRDLLGDNGGRDVAAGVIAHEIGHNLGLDHVGQSNNLMASGGTEERLTAAQKSTIFTDNAGSDGYELLQSLTATGSNYSQWAGTNGVTLGPAGDDDRDGISNVIEFMLSMNPKVPGVLPQPVVSAQGLTWTLTKRPEAVADGLVYAVQTGSGLQSWLAAGAGGSGSTVVQDTSTTLSVRLNFGAARRFMRLNITIPAGL